MTDSVQSQIEAVLRGIEERTPHDENECLFTMGDVTSYGPPSCTCDRAARVRAEQARTVERMIDAAITALRPSYADVAWAAALRAGEDQKET